MAIRNFCMCVWTLVIIFEAVASGDDILLQSRNRRQIQRCPAEVRIIAPNHSSCLLPSSSVTEKGVSQTERTDIVALHNKIRSEVSPTATNMMRMSWDEEIANTAQRWAENCVLSHDDNYNRYAFGRFAVGQNIFIGWGAKMSWTQAIQTWLSENATFQYGTQPLTRVGHYTQLVWAESSRVGCGYAKCAGAVFYVCNYGPAGNKNNDLRTPYNSGPPCANCPNNCRQNLCSCSNVNVCLNGGTLNLQSCACQCTKNLPYFTQPDCKLDCDKVTQEPITCIRVSPDVCRTYANIPQECPRTCGWCSGNASVTTPVVPVTPVIPGVIPTTLYPGQIQVNITSGVGAPEGRWGNGFICIAILVVNACIMMELF